MNLSYEDNLAFMVMKISQLQNKMSSLSDVLTFEDGSTLEDLSTLYNLNYRIDDIKYRQKVIIDYRKILEKLLEKNILSQDNNNDLAVVLKEKISWHFEEFLKALSWEVTDSCTQICHDSRCNNIIQEWGKLCEQLQVENLKFVNQ